jgi:hypothetical protein
MKWKKDISLIFCIPPLLSECPFPIKASDTSRRRKTVYVLFVGFVGGGAFGEKPSEYRAPSLHEPRPTTKFIAPPCLCWGCGRMRMSGHDFSVLIIQGYVIQPNYMLLPLFLRPRVDPTYKTTFLPA